MSVVKTGGAVVAALVVLLAGCATAQRAALLAEDSLARAATAGYLALDQYDQQKVAAIKAQAQSGDVAGAMAEVQKYGPVRARAIAALDSAAGLIQAADDARQGTGAAVADPKGFLDYAPQFVKAGAEIIAALKDAGVPVPGALTSALSALGVK